MSYFLGDNVILSSQISGNDSHYSKLLQLLQIELVIGIVTTIMVCYAVKSYREAMKERAKLLEKVNRDRLTKLLTSECLFNDYMKDGTLDKVVLFFDIEKLRNINKKYGNDVGDEILRIYGERILELGFNENAYRIAGDEVVVVVNVDEVDEEEVYEKLQEAFIIPNAALEINLKVRIYKFDPNELGKKFLFTEIIALFTYMKDFLNVKKDEVVVVDNTHIKERHKYLEISRKLESGIRQTGIEPFFQPYMAIGDKDNLEIIGCEALSRWTKDGEQQYYINEFLPIIENSGMLKDLDLYIFEKTVEFFQKLIDEGLVGEKFKVSSNFSAYTLSRLKVEEIQEIMSNYSVPIEKVYLEVTEQNMIDEDSVKIISDLRNIGYRIAVDDFSAGHSSLDLLTRFPVDILKIDRSLLENLICCPKCDVAGKECECDDIEDKSYLIYFHIVALAKQMKLSVISEGVERQEQVELLRKLKVDTVQGFLFSRPIPESKFIKKLKDVKIDLATKVKD